MNLHDFTTLTFDCYGTLIDWESGMVKALEPLTSRVKQPLSRDDILAAHARHESSQQSTTPAKRYSDLLAVVYKRLAEEWDVPVSWAECRAYGASVGDWPAFPDSAEALQYLKQHYKLVILSNVDNESFALSNKKLGIEFDAIYTAEDIGSYKPSLRNFEYMLDKLTTLGVGRGDILHTAESLFHDHAPANQVGLTSCWIHRRHAAGGFGATMKPDSMPKLDFKFTSLGELAEAHHAEAVRAAKKTNTILQRYNMKELYDQYKTHSAVIRFLASKGFSKSEISQATGKIYQHVRNVLVQDAQKKAAQNNQPQSTTTEE